MQLMPGTAVRFGADSTASAAGNIHAGVSYLNTSTAFGKTHCRPDSAPTSFWPRTTWAPVTCWTPNAFTEMEGLDPNIWFDQVETMLARKSESEFYRRMQSTVIVMGHLPPDMFVTLLVTTGIMPAYWINHEDNRLVLCRLAQPY